MPEAITPQVPLAIAAKIRNLREIHGLNQGQFCKVSGISRGYLSRLENGVAEPSLAAVEKICAGAGVSLCQFFTGDCDVLVMEATRHLRTLSPRQWQSVLNVIQECIKFRGNECQKSNEQKSKKPNGRPYRNTSGYARTAPRLSMTA